MGQSAFRAGLRSLALAAVFACAPATAHAGESSVDFASAKTLKVYGDVRAVAADGEASWLKDGFGKLRYGGDDPANPGNLRAEPQFGEAGVVWQPRFGWELSGTVVALAQGADDRKIDAGLSEAFLTFKPLSGGPLRISARAGLFWPPVSIEHTGPEWAVADTITPSAIGSWMGEEVKVVGLELNAKTRLGNDEIALTLASFDFNDTAGALLTFRGWALHDRKALAFREQPLPPLNGFMQQVQPPYSHPTLDLEPGLFKRPGFYVKLAWTASIPLHVELFHYDNNANPEAVNADLEWGWRTRFNALGVIADLGGGRVLRAQGMSGSTHMGFKMGGVDWIDTRFDAAFGMLTQRLGRGSVSARLDLFGTRNHGSAVGAADDEDGWAATVAAKRELGEHLTAFVEYLHVDSRRDARSRAVLASSQTQNQVQVAMRARW